MFGKKFPFAALAIGCILVTILQTEGQLFPHIPFLSGCKPCPATSSTPDIPPFLSDISAAFKDMIGKFSSFGKELSFIKGMIEQMMHKLDQSPEPAPVPAKPEPAGDAAIDSIPAAPADPVPAPAEASPAEVPAAIA